MPKVHRNTQGTVKAVALYYITLAIPQVGCGYPRPLSNSTKTDKVLHCGEAELVATILAERIKHFYWKKIICRFDLSTEIVSDNRTQFASQSIATFCTQLKIKQLFTSVEHLQSNGQAEATNKCLEEAKGRWVEELPQELWSYHTTPHSTTNETHFRLTFGTEVFIPVEIGESSPRTVLFQLSLNKEELSANLDLLQEAREVAHIKEYVVKARAAKRQDKKLVDVKKNHTDHRQNQIDPNWEGLFRIIEDIGKGAYPLEHLDGKKIPQT
ncbi:Tf2-11, partial [Mucuna pruriens]